MYPRQGPGRGREENIDKQQKKGGDKYTRAPANYTTNKMRMNFSSDPP